MGRRIVEFNVEHIAPIVWNDQLFGNLAINRDQKVLIQSLIESEVQLDDFVKGKGLGLVINLFGMLISAVFQYISNTTPPI